jgi:hypothetical protein
MQVTELSPREVAERVRPYVNSKFVGDISLSVDEARVHLRNGYWRVPVRPSREPKPLFAYYEALADLEEEVQEKEGLRVTIASGDPLTDEAA